MQSREQAAQQNLPQRLGDQFLGPHNLQKKDAGHARRSFAFEARELLRGQFRKTSHQLTQEHMPGSNFMRDPGNDSTDLTAESPEVPRIRRPGE